MDEQSIDLSFPHRWRAELLAARPLILPRRRFTYPREVEEVERGALEILVHPAEDDGRATPGEEPFLATCALGFRDPAVPTGVWSSPNPEELCAVAGGYAYLIDTRAPERFAMLHYRPVLAVIPAVEQGVLLFVSSQKILTWGAAGQVWESPKLSDEGITILGIEGVLLRGLGWNMTTDREAPFMLDLRQGLARTSN